MVQGAGILVGECFQFKYLLHTLLLAHGLQFINWPDQLGVESFTETHYLEISTTNWIQLHEACVMKEDGLKLVSEYDPAYWTLHFSDASLMHLRSSSTYSDVLRIGLRMLCNSTPPPASAPPHMPPLLVCLFVCLCHWHMCCLFCLFVSPSRLVLLIDGQWTSAKSNCTHSIRRGLGRRLRSSLLLNSSPRCDLPCRIVY